MKNNTPWKGGSPCFLKIILKGWLVTLLAILKKIHGQAKQAKRFINTMTKRARMPVQVPNCKSRKEHIADSLTV
jgi:hypothetical protein